MSPPVAPMCDCNHPARAHGNDGCHLPNCFCSEDSISARITYPDPWSMDREPLCVSHNANPVVTKACSRCGEVKPLDEFHSIGAGRKRPYCRDCYMPGASKPVTSRALIKSRARARALAELAERHKDEYSQLLLVHMRTAKDESDRMALAVYSDDDVDEQGQAQPLRLRRGQYRSGQSVEDRIDTDRCADCASYHDNGHHCESCGASPCDEVAS